MDYRRQLTRIEGIVAPLVPGEGVGKTLVSIRLCDVHSTAEEEDSEILRADGAL